MNIIMTSFIQLEHSNLTMCSEGYNATTVHLTDDDHENHLQSSKHECMYNMILFYEHYFMYNSDSYQC